MTGSEPGLPAPWCWPLSAAAPLGPAAAGGAAAAPAAARAATGAAAAAAVLPAGPERREAPGQSPEPWQGQPGKDVIWLPTPEALVERMLTMAQVSARDVVYDLGSGDGRMVIAAARRGARSVGVEFEPELVALSERRARAEGVERRARFVQGDIFATDFGEATVVTLYLLPTLNMRLRPTLLRMRPGTRVVSHAFRMEDWEPDESSRAEQRTAYLWIVPASVEGAWRVDLEGGPSFDVRLAQRFQRIEGTVALGPVDADLREAALRGDRIRFGFVDGDGVWHELTGTASPDRKLPPQIAWLSHWAKAAAKASMSFGVTSPTGVTK